MTLQRLACMLWRAKIVVHIAEFMSLSLRDTGSIYSVRMRVHPRVVSVNSPGSRGVHLARFTLFVRCSLAIARFTVERGLRPGRGLENKGFSEDHH